VGKCLLGADPDAVAGAWHRFSHGAS
jgi:hypothetical protein